MPSLKNALKLLDQRSKSNLLSRTEENFEPVPQQRCLHPRKRKKTSARQVKIIPDWLRLQ